MCLTCQDLFGVLNIADTPDELIEICQLFCTLKFQISSVSALENLKSLGIEELEPEIKMDAPCFMEKLLNELCFLWFGGIFMHHL